MCLFFYEKAFRIDLFNLRFLSKNESVSLPAFLGVPVGKVKTGTVKQNSFLAIFFCCVHDRALSFGAITKRRNEKKDENIGKTAYVSPSS